MGLTLNEMFPSQYINGDDLKGRAFTLTIRSVKQEQIFDVKENKRKLKWVIYFAPPAKKGCLCGVTQASQIFEALDLNPKVDTYDDWIGRKVEIYPTEVKAFGKKTIAPRFRKLTKAGETAVPEALTVDVVDDEEEEGDDHHNVAPPDLVPPTQTEPISQGEQLFGPPDPLADLRVKSLKNKNQFFGDVKAAKTVQSLDAITSKMQSAEMLAADIDLVSGAIEAKRTELEKKLP